jgi:hypothetical protein
MPVGLTRMRFRRLRRAGGRRLATVDAWGGIECTFSCKQKSVLNPSIQDAWQPSPRTAKTLLDSTWQQKSCKSHIRNFHRLRRNSKTLPEVIAESSFLEDCMRVCRVRQLRAWQRMEDGDSCYIGAEAIGLASFPICPFGTTGA